MRSENTSPEQLAPSASERPKHYTIAELAREFDITPRTIRFYEDLGLLQPTRVRQQRVYAPRDRTRLGLILRGKRLGFSLHEAKALVMMYESPADTEPQLQAFLQAIQTQRTHLEGQMADIRTTLAELQAHEARCRELLAAEHQQSANLASTLSPPSPSQP